MAKSDRRRKAIAEKRARRKNAMSHPGGSSNYARKKKYCDKNGVWGWEVLVKPWR